MRSNPMATITTAPAALLHEYLSKVNESAEVRRRAITFALLSRHGTRVRLELFEHVEDAKPVRVIDLDSARHRTGGVWHVWSRVSSRVNSMLIALTDPMNRIKAIVSISIGCSWTPSRQRSRSCLPGISHRHVATTPRRQSKTWRSQAGQRRFDAQMRTGQRALRLGRGSAAPASLVEDDYL